MCIRDSIRCAQTESRLTSARLRLQEEKAKQISSIPAHLAGPIAEEMSKDQYDTNPEEFLQTLKTKWLTKMQEMCIRDRRRAAPKSRFFGT